MLNQKERQILQYLIEKRDQFTTSKELADYLFCSDRTVRTYLKQLHQFLEDYDGIDIISKQGYGYKLIVLDTIQFQKIMHETEDTPIINDSQDRYKYILNKLLFEQSQLYFDDLAEKLYISRSTLSYEFKKIRKDLGRYQLSVESKANKGVYISGEERNKRRFIMDHFFRDYFFKNKSIHNYINENVPLPIINIEELTFIVLEECREAKLKLSDFVIQNLVVHIALALRRINDGFKMTSVKELDDTHYPLEQEVSKKILHRIYLTTGILCPKEEADYITLHLISKKTLMNDDMSKQYSQSQLQQQLIHVLATMPQVSQHDFQSDAQLIDGVVTHLMTLLIRLQTDIHLENPLSEMIQTQYKPIFNMTKDILKQLPVTSHYVISDDEVAYVTLHFMAAIERQKDKHKYHILVICATGYGSAQLLKNRIESEFGNSLIIKDVIGYYDLCDKKLENVDFIISSIDLSHLVFSVPVCTVSVFLNMEELRHIKDTIKQLQHANKIELPHQAKQNESIEDIFDTYFSKDCFMIVDDSDKASLINQMAEMLSINEEQAFKGYLLEYIEQREKMSSVIFSHTIAVPHPIKPIAKQPRIAVAIVKNGMQWEKDYNGIQFIFLPSPSIYGNDGLKALTSLIVSLVDDDIAQQAMINCQSFDEFKQLFLKVGEEK